MNVQWIRRFVGAFALGALVLVVAPTDATVWRVPGNGVEVSVVVDSLAAPGDTVQVMGNGGATFFTRIVIEKDLTIQGGWRADFQVRDPSIYVTVFQDIADSFENQRAILRVNGSHRLEVDGVTIVGGRFGIRAEDAADIVVRDCVIRSQDNTSIPIEGFRLAGGGIRMSGGTLLVENSTIRNARTFIHGAGLGLVGVSSATIRDSVIRNCFARFPNDVSNEANGAGIYASGVGSLSIEACRLENNTSLDRGGHIFASGSGVSITNSTLTRGAGSNLGGGVFATGGVLTIDGTSIESCIGGSGAAVYAASVQQMTVTNSQLRQNLASGNGGAFLLTNTPFTIRDCVFEHNNQAPPAPVYAARGGSVHATASGGVVEDTTFRDEWAEIGGVWFQAGGTVVTRRCSFQNTRSDLQGGAVYIELSGLFRAENCLFVDGAAKFGAGIAAAFGARIELDHCTIARGAASSTGGALYLETASTGSVTNSILCLATRSDLVACPAASVAFSNCDIWNDDAQNARAEFAPDCANPIGTAGNFSANPQFCDASGTELRLAPGSPCVGAGSDGSDLGWMLAGCPAGIPLSIVPESWSRIKSHYRTGSEVPSTPD